jgi:hypothetical protein
MSFRTLVLVGLVALLASGCACRRTTGNNENIGIVSGDSDLKDIHYAFDSLRA